MNNSLKILFIAILGLGILNASSKENNSPESPVLFADRDFCVSGDTVWFKVLLPKLSENTGDIVRVQLNSKSNNLISEVAVKSKESWAQGFISIPDSLSTGQYFLTAFLNRQRNYAQLELENKSLLVYNRFAEGITEMELIRVENTAQTAQNNGIISLNTDKKLYQTRENVNVEIKVNPGFDLKHVIVKATLIDPLAEEIKAKYIFEMQSSNPLIPDFNEKAGVLLNGYVTDKNGIKQTDAVVVLSMAGEKPYFDYYVLGENGDFHFFIKEAFGNAKVVLQVVANNQKEYVIELENNSLIRNGISERENKVLNSEQVEFISSAINANFAHKLFNPAISVQSDSFEFPARFIDPFYGEPTERVIPDEFIDLPNFQEISRELLPGLQYRAKNNEVTFRLINSSYRVSFENEPLRLINGIPVFKNDLFVNLKSTDISLVEIVRSERIYGDIVFKGVLAVSLYDKSNSWLAQQPNNFEFNVNFLQKDRKPAYLTEQHFDSTFPDMRQTYFWDILKTDSIGNIQFLLSDRKGKVEISVEGFTNEDEFFKTSKMIEVK